MYLFTNVYIHLNNSLATISFFQDTEAKYVFPTTQLVSCKTTWSPNFLVAITSLTKWRLTSEHMTRTCFLECTEKWEYTELSIQGFKDDGLVHDGYCTYWVNPQKAHSCSGKSIWYMLYHDAALRFCTVGFAPLRLDHQRPRDSAITRQKKGSSPLVGFWLNWMKAKISRFLQVEFNVGLTIHRVPTIADHDDLCFPLSFFPLLCVGNSHVDLTVGTNSRGTKGPTRKSLRNGASSWVVSLINHLVRDTSERTHVGPKECLCMYPEWHCRQVAFLQKIKQNQTRVNLG